jgi:hypothetical protein
MEPNLVGAVLVLQTNAAKLGAPFFALKMRHCTSLASSFVQVPGPGAQSHIMKSPNHAPDTHVTFRSSSHLLSLVTWGGTTRLQ